MLNNNDAVGGEEGSIPVKICDFMFMGDEVIA